MRGRCWSATSGLATSASCTTPSSARPSYVRVGSSHGNIYPFGRRARWHRGGRLTCLTSNGERSSRCFNRATGTNRRLHAGWVSLGHSCTVDCAGTNSKRPEHREESQSAHMALVLPQKEQGLRTTISRRTKEASHEPRVDVLIRRRLYAH